jgi:flagellar biosynthesis GTPase FlhF
MIHRIHGRSLTDALRRAREEHGADAVVVSQETRATGEVTIAVSRRPTSAQRPGRDARDRRDDPGIADLRERLERHGASKPLIEHAVRAVRESGVRGAYALDAAARALGRAFPAQPSPKRDGVTRVIALVGPSGAGKTTTLAKIGRRLQSGGRSVLFASLDGLGVTALEHRMPRTEADADRHELPIHAIAGTAEIDEEQAVATGLDVILLDTPGVGVRDADGIAALASELGRLGAHAQIEVHLVLPATHDAAALDLALRAYAPVIAAVRARGGAAAAVLTKLDETPRPAAALERCGRAHLAISFLCDGADARGHLRRARADHVADLFLRGRIAA